MGQSNDVPNSAATESAMGRFSGKSKSSFTDWARMEFMRGDINQFMDTLAGYKATISVGLGVLTM